MFTAEHYKKSRETGVSEITIDFIMLLRNIRNKKPTPLSLLIMTGMLFQKG